MNPFHPRGTHEYLETRAWLGNIRDAGRIEFKRDIAFELAGVLALEIVGSEGGLDQYIKPPEDTVVVKACYGVESLKNPVLDVLGFRFPIAQNRIETSAEEGDQQRRDIQVPGQGVGNKGLAKSEAQLLDVAGVGSQQADFTPVQTRRHHQLVEVVVFSETIPDFPEPFLKSRFGRFDICATAAGMTFHGKITDTELLAVTPPNTIRVLPQHSHAKILKDRNHI